MSEPVIYAASWLINPGEPAVAGGAILVSGRHILATGTLAYLKRKYSAPLIEYPGCTILPGFVNAHTHLDLTHFPSWRLRKNIDYNPSQFTDWIIQLIKIARGLTLQDYQSSVREGMRLCLESGTTAVGEIVTNPLLSKLYNESTLAGRLYFEVLGHDPVRFNNKLGAALAAAESGETGPMKTGLSPHSTYTIGQGHLPTIYEASHTNKLPLSIHVSESAAETSFIFDSTGPLAEDFYPFVGWEGYLTRPIHCSSTELLSRHELLTPNTLAVHCVHVTIADARILRGRGVSIALCPRSNYNLDVGLAPVAMFKKLGVSLALGTDSLASNDSLSLWDEMRYSLEVFPNDLSPEDVFQMVTIGGASALGIAKDCGSLDVGKRADFQVVNNCGDIKKGLLERIVRSGRVLDVYSFGAHYAGNHG